MKVFVDTPGLAGAGAALSGQVAPPAVPPVIPAAADPVSQSVAAILATRAMGISTVLAHGDAMRAVGGHAVTGTSATFVRTDADNAELLLGDGSPAGPGGIGAATMIPPVPDVPSVPAMPAPPVMPGEMYATMVHDGPGGAPLRQTAQLLRGQLVAALRSQADDVIATGSRIDVAWDDGGVQRAGRNTVRHGTWLHQMADETEALAGAFDESADQLDRTRGAVPTPAEFQQARQRLLHAQARRDPSGMAQAAAHYADLQTRATDTMLGYHGEATTTTMGLTTPLRTAPAIASGPDDQIVGGPKPGSPHIQMVDDTTETPTPGAQPQIGPFPVPPAVRDAAPPQLPQPPLPVDPTGGLLTPSTLPAQAAPAPGIPGVNPVPPPMPSAPPVMHVPAAPAPAATTPSCSVYDWTKAILEPPAGIVAILTAAPEGATGVGVPVALSQIALGTAAVADGMDAAGKCMD